ncbi:MAG: hypothetical protein JNM63_10595 [Spirochaetia bacterium]|nr:hypothetical protein [Spirochaetia bacterium]
MFFFSRALFLSFSILILGNVLFGFISRDESAELRFFGVEKDSDGPLLVSSPIVSARADTVRKLVAAAKYREAARELLDLRQELPRKGDFFVNFWLGVTYRNIAESIRDGVMVEDEKGDLYYRDEIDRGRANAPTLLPYQKNLSYFTDEDVKKLARKFDEDPSLNQTPVVTNINGTNAFVFTNLTPYPYWVTNKRVEFDVRTNVTPDIEVTLTHWRFATNQTVSPRIAVVTNLRISNYQVVVTNKPPAPTNAKGELEYIYDFYPDKETMFNGKRISLIKTNQLANTNFSYLSNAYAVTNFNVVSNAVTSKRYDKPLVAFTLSSNRRDVTWLTTNEGTNVAIFTNILTNQTVVTNHFLLAQREKSDRDSLSLRKEFSLRSLKPMSPASLKYYELAIAWLNTLIANDASAPFQESAVLQKAEIFSDIGERELSVETYAFFEKKFPRSKRRIDSLIGQANVFLGAEDWGRSESAFSEALRRFPGTDKKDYIKMKLDFLQMAREKAGRGEALTTLVETEIQKELARFEAWEAEIKRREGRLREVQFFRSRVLPD